MSERIWWCEEHQERANGDGTSGAHGCWVAGRVMQADEPRCRMVERILASPDSIIIERQNGEWPEEVRETLEMWHAPCPAESQEQYLKWTPDDVLDSLAEWSQSRE